MRGGYGLGGVREGKLGNCHRTEARYLTFLERDFAVACVYGRVRSIVVSHQEELHGAGRHSGFGGEDCLDKSSLVCVKTQFVNFMYLSFNIFFRFDHTNMTTPLPVCSAKLSMFWSD